MSKMASHNIGQKRSHDTIDLTGSSDDEIDTRKVKKPRRSMPPITQRVPMPRQTGELPLVDFFSLLTREIVNAQRTLAPAAARPQLTASTSRGMPSYQTQLGPGTSGVNPQFAAMPPNMARSQQTNPTVNVPGEDLQ